MLTPLDEVDTPMEDGAAQLQSAAPSSPAIQQCADNSQTITVNQRHERQIQLSAAAYTRLQEQLGQQIVQGPTMCPKCEKTETQMTSKGRVGAVSKRTLLTAVALICQCGGATVISSVIGVNAQIEGPRQTEFMEMERMLQETKTAHELTVSSIMKNLQGKTEKAAKPRAAGGNRAITSFFGRKAVEGDSPELEQAKARIAAQDSQLTELKSIIEDLQQQLRDQTNVIGEMAGNIRQLQQTMNRPQPPSDRPLSQDQTIATPTPTSTHPQHENPQQNSAPWKQTGKGKNSKTPPGYNPVSSSPNENIVTSRTRMEPNTGPTRPQPKGAPHSFAEAARYGKAKIKSPKEIARAWNKQMEKAFTASTEPIEFAKIQFVVPNTKSLKALKPYARREWVAKALKFLGVKSVTFEHSLIGNSIIEIYVPVEEATKVKRKLSEQDVELVKGNNLCPVNHTQSNDHIKQAIISRIAVLLNRAKLQRLKACILRDQPTEIREAATAKAAAWLKTHTDKNVQYSENISMELDVPLPTSNDNLGPQHTGPSAGKRQKTHPTDSPCSAEGAERL